MIAPDPAPAAARPSAARPEGLPAEAPHRDRPESGAATDFGAVVAERPAKRGRAGRAARGRRAGRRGSGPCPRPASVGPGGSPSAG